MTDRLEQLARQGCRRWRTHRLYPDFMQEARIVAWQHQDKPDSHIVRIVNFRVIEAARRELGRSGYTPREELLTVDADGTPELATVDYPNPALEWGLTGRNHLIARMLAYGIEKRAIAQHFGIHPSRVTQLLAQLRTAHKETLPRGTRREPMPDPLFKIDVTRTSSTCTTLVAADRHAREHYNGAGHRRLGIVARDDHTLTVYYAQDART